MDRVINDSNNSIKLFQIIAILVKGFFEKLLWKLDKNREKEEELREILREYMTEEDIDIYIKKYRER